MFSGLQNAPVCLRFFLSLGLLFFFCVACLPYWRINVLIDNATAVSFWGDRTPLLIRSRSQLNPYQKRSHLILLISLLRTIALMSSRSINILASRSLSKFLIITLLLQATTSGYSLSMRSYILSVWHTLTLITCVILVHKRFVLL